MLGIGYDESEKNLSKFIEFFRIDLISNSEFTLDVANTKCILLILDCKMFTQAFELKLFEKQRKLPYICVLMIG